MTPLINLFYTTELCDLFKIMHYRRIFRIIFRQITKKEVSILLLSFGTDVLVEDFFHS